MRVCILVLVAIGLSTSTAPAATRFVNKNGGADGNGGTDAMTDAWRTIQHAVDTITHGDEIQVSEGIYVESVTNAAWDNIVLKGGYDDTSWAWAPGVNRTIVKAANASSTVLTISRTNNAVTGLVLTGGTRGLYANYAAANVLLAVTRCVISNNTSHGIENTSRHGIDVRNCLIARNGGRGVYLNTAENNVSCYLYNCTVVSNTSDGVYRQGRYIGYTTIRNCIVAGNGGLGVYRFWAAQSDAYYLYLDTSCVHGNSAGNILSASYSDRIPAGVGMVCADPVVGADFAPQDGSPCVDTAEDLSGIGIADDLNGTARTGAWDMGCYESAFSAAPRYAATYADVARPDDSGAGTTPATAKRTINAALAITQPGGTCTVQPGLYNEHVFVPSGVSLRGQSRDTTMVSNNWRAIVMGNANATASSLSVLGRSFSVALELKGTSNRVSDCRVQTATNGGWGVWISGPYNQVADSQVSSNLYGIYLGTPGQAYATLARCRIADNGSHGVWLNCRTPVFFHNLLVTGNGGTGLRLAFAEDYADRPPSKILHCTVAGNRGDGIFHSSRYTANVMVSNTVCAVNGGYGIVRVAGLGDGHRLYLGYSCVSTNTLGVFSNDFPLIEFGAGLITNAAPRFVGHGLQPHMLDTLSPGVDAAPNIGITNDLLQVARPNRSIAPPTGLDFDMGAYETVRYHSGIVITLK